MGKTEALRTYLFAYASIYDAFHLDQLVGMFDLPSKTVHSIVSKMMYENQLAAFWDESSKYVLVQHSEPTHLQRLALTLADRGAQAVENNERLVDQKGGGSAFKDPRQQQAGQWDNRGGQGRRGLGGGKGDKGRDSKGKGKGKGRASMRWASLGTVVWRTPVLACEAMCSADGRIHHGTGRSAGGRHSRKSAGSR